MGNQFASLAKAYWSAQDGDNTQTQKIPEPLQNGTSNVDIRPVTNGDDEAKVADAQNGAVALVPEALPNMRILINHEMPNGAGNEHNITVNPKDSVSQLRATMEYFTQIPRDNIYFVHKTTTLQDDRSLTQQGVEPWDTLAMRDNRLSYQHPY